MPEIHGNDNNGNAAVWTQKYSTILQTITVGAVFISGFYVAVIWPLNKQIDDLKREGVTNTDSKLIEDDINRRFDVQRIEGKLVSDDIDRRFDLDHNAILKLQDNQVPRTEHEEHWKNEQERITEMNLRMEDLSKEVNGSTAVSDAIKALQKELDDLRIETHTDTKK